MTPNPVRRESPWSRARPAPPPSRRRGFRPSVTFLLVLLIFIGSGVALWRGVAHPVLPFVFILAGWIVSVCLHEFGHAIVAYAGGDKSVVASGYLTLDPLKYAHPLLSIVLPALFIALGGFALPGGAVLINTAALRSRLWESFVSAAGPAMTALIAVLLGLAFTVGLGQPGGTRAFYAALAFLCFLQVIAVVLNLLPIPGLDGFNIIRPWLPRAMQQTANRMAAAGLVFVLIAVLVMVPGVGAWIVAFGLDGAQALGVPRNAVVAGQRLFRFWSSGDVTVNLASAAGLGVLSFAVMKLGMMMDDPAIDRRRAWLGGALLAAMMIAAVLLYERFIPR